MSLSLIQGYSSAEEEEEQEAAPPGDYVFSSDDDGGDGSSASAAVTGRLFSYKSVLDQSAPATGSSSLPSAFDAFSEISGPPQFLNNSVEDQTNRVNVQHQFGRRGRWRKKEKKDLPSGVVVEAKAQIVGIRERVRSDVESNQPATTSVLSTTQAEKRMPTATNPNAEDAAELLRMCSQCGIPKTFSNAKGMVCPVCGDRPPPPNDASTDTKKKGSTLKDKEKSKRMKGQSSHATWKSETEMHLRQQFD